MKNILVATEFNDGWENLIQWTVSFARNVNSRVSLINVLDPDPEFVGYEVGPKAYVDAIRQQEDEKKLRLEALVEVLGKHGIESNCTQIRGEVVKMILECVEDTVAELLLVGFKPRSLFKCILTGRTVEELINSSPCPVIMVPLETELVSVKVEELTEELKTAVNA